MWGSATSGLSRGFGCGRGRRPVRGRGGARARRGGGRRGTSDSQSRTRGGDTAVSPSRPAGHQPRVRFRPPRRMPPRPQQRSGSRHSSTFLPTTRPWHSTWRHPSCSLCTSHIVSRRPPGPRSRSGSAHSHHCRVTGADCRTRNGTVSRRTVRIFILIKKQRALAVEVLENGIRGSDMCCWRRVTDAPQLGDANSCTALARATAHGLVSVMILPTDKLRRAAGI